MQSHFLSVLFKRTSAGLEKVVLNLKNQKSCFYLMKTNYELRAAARESLSGNWTYPVLATLIYLAISITCNFIPYVSFLIAIFFIQPLAYGLAITMLKFFRGEKEYVVENMFSIFSDYPRILGTILLQFVYIFLWSLLLLIPGLIKMYSYAMTYYILHDNPEIGAEERTL